MKLSHVLLFFGVSTVSVILPCHAIDRDLTVACALDLTECQQALTAAESSCAVPQTPPTPTPPTAPVAPGTLVKAGDDNEPPGAFPLNLCEGDCDGDADCSGSLVCYQRDSDTVPVPGCIGTPDIDGSDYCCDTSFDGCVSSEGGEEPTCGFVCLINEIITEVIKALLGLNPRRSLREQSSVDIDGNERKLLFGVIQNECQQLLERCNRLLTEFSCPPTISPSLSPSVSPTKSQNPSPGPSESPTPKPSLTRKPSKSPTKRPTKQPTKAPTGRPVRPPTAAPVAQMGMGKRRDYYY